MTATEPDAAETAGQARGAVDVVNERPNLIQLDFERDAELRRDHFGVFERLADGPSFVYSETPGFWMFTKAENIEAALKRTDLFSNRQMSAMKRDREKRVPYKFIPEQLDPPEHGLYRKIITPMLSPARMKRLEPRVREVARGLAEAMLSAGRGEVVAEFSRPLVVHVFTELLGLPLSEANTFGHLARTLVVGDPNDDDGSIVGKAFTDLTDYLGGYLEARRVQPREDLLTGIVQAEVNGEPITLERQAEIALLLFVGGLETTVASMSYLVRHCADDTATQDAIRADPTLVPAAVEESLRFYSQISMSRQVRVDTEFEGCPMKEGDYLVLPLAAAGRDTAAFADARRFDLHRQDNRHIAFGVGPHRCAGSHLARVEMYAAMDEFHKVIPSYRHTVDASRDDYVVGVSGPLRVDIEWDSGQGTR
ncbi:cytochrome P450 [Pseudonocardia xishanensis]|uniref:Cytochrome P450 n=1 Tax=Pseudonocardia xishanensis TaxID=630995 RepID=A0ABP8RY85_9PSEU